ncbi:hypothetical protein C9374_009465 [Naegleria lovaniensis]|uniref:Uncharacterized protein n=1 Tax=Naegleria lovaniensis TaxID=51637 RepID=A0AA88KP74_NAELO|nr:uncharacterized protein C9374_009465 [Naegleria lovaniensis]KAG2392888.1 hypothetical protein C9374_009465 [Naegleria lovaniensis]
MPGGIHFLFGLILFYILQWIAYFLRKQQQQTKSSTSSRKHQDTNHDNCTLSTPHHSTMDTKIQLYGMKPHPSSSLSPSSDLKINEDHHSQTTTITPLAPLLHRIYHRRIDREWFQFGIIVGSVMPDVDLCLAIVSIVFCYLFLGYDGEDNRQVAEAVHRTATHSLILCVPLLILFIYMYNKRDYHILNKKKQSPLNLSTKNHSTSISSGSNNTSSMMTAHLRVTDTSGHNSEIMNHHQQHQLNEEGAAQSLTTTTTTTNDNISTTSAETTNDEDMIQESTLISSRVLSDEHPHLHEHSPSIDDDAPSGLKAAAPLNNFSTTSQVGATSEHVTHSHITNHHHHGHKSQPYSKLPLWGKFMRDFKWLNLPFAIGFLVGAIFHIFLDVIYMKGVKLFWPIYGEEIFCEIPWLYLYDNFKYSPMVQKVIMTCDHTSEILFYIAILYYRRKIGKVGLSLNENHEIEEEAKPAHPNQHHSLFHHKRNGHVVVFQKHRTFINLLKHLKNLPHSYTEFIRELWNASEDDWDTIFKYFCGVQIFAVWFTFSLMYFFFPEMGFVQFVIFIYFPGTVCVLISLLAPFCFRETLSRWDWSHLIHGTPKHVDPLSAHLYHQGSIAGVVQ